MTSGSRHLGRNFYHELYTKDLEAEVQWLRMGAADKCDSVGFLLSKANLKPDSIIELGCGTGELIKECQRRGYANKYAAVDYSEPAVQLLRSTSQGIEVHAADITAPSFSISGHWDVVLMSHVIEHLDDPTPMLRALKRFDYSYFIAEIPLENLPLAKLKSYVKNRMKNPAGHVQFFNDTSFKKLLSSVGFEIIHSRRYRPTQSAQKLRFMCKKKTVGGRRRRCKRW